MGPIWSKFYFPHFKCQMNKFYVHATTMNFRSLPKTPLQMKSSWAKCYFSCIRATIAKLNFWEQISTMLQMLASGYCFRSILQTNHWLRSAIENGKVIQIINKVRMMDLNPSYLSTTQTSLHIETSCNRFNDKPIWVLTCRKFWRHSCLVGREQWISTAKYLHFSS